MTAGADTAEDLAGWWAGPEEVEEDTQRLGWTEADRLGTVFALSEAKRPAVQRLPRVRVPGELPIAPGPTPVLALPHGPGELSLESLAPVASRPLGTDRYRPILRQIYLDLGSQDRYGYDTDIVVYYFEKDHRPSDRPTGRLRPTVRPTVRPADLHALRAW